MVGRAARSMGEGQKTVGGPLAPGEAKAVVRRIVSRAAAVTLLALAAASTTSAAVPYPSPGPGSDPRDYTQFKLPAGVVPNEIPADANALWKFAGSPEPGNEPVNSNPQELYGVRGASVADQDPQVRTAFELTTGRPDVTIATLDSGIKWNDESNMVDLRNKTRLNEGELPLPWGSDGATCTTAAPDPYDCNDDGIFNLADYAHDPRVLQVVDSDPRRVGPSGLMTPEDLLIAFSAPDFVGDGAAGPEKIKGGRDDDGNGYVDDIVGWDFLDNDNDPYDDVQYGHGTGESLDAAGEADNRSGSSGRSVSMCPNCQVMYLRVGDSFVADVDNFAQAAIYATDNDALVIQEALGALNNSRLARQAVNYSYDHGVTTIASAADESAQHHNWPSSYPHVIVVNSVRKYNDVSGLNEEPKSYLLFNGCTNFSSKITVSVPSKECSSDATGKGGAMAGLIYSAALNAHDNGDLAPSTDCVRPDGSRCVITPNEVRQAMASGTIDGQGLADDINFATQPETSCATTPLPSCTNPMTLPGDYAFNYPLVPESRRFPTRRGHDQFTGWGRTNMRRTIDAVQSGAIPPEAEITSPQWFSPIDPDQASFEVSGHVYARGEAYTCQVEVAPGSYPNNGEVPAGDFSPVSSTECDGVTPRSDAYDGVLGTVDVATLKARFPANATGFDGREPGIGTAQTSNGRPNIEPYGFVVRVVVTKSGAGEPTMTGEDRRNFYLHRDQDLVPGFPKKLTSDGAASPLLVDLSGDNRNELVVATSDGDVHAFEPDGSELVGWPARVDRLPLHTGDPNGGYARGEADGSARDAILASPAAADLNHDGIPEVVVADLHGKVYAFDAGGQRLWEREIDIDYSGKPLQPFVNVRKGQRNRTQHAFIASPVLADIDGNDGGKLEVVAAAMDRHVYAWNDDGSPVPGYPELVVDRTKVESIDPQTHAITFNADAGSPLDQGAIIDTPAVGDISGDSRPEIIVGTNEEYRADQGNEGPLNLGSFNTASIAALSAAGVFDPANIRLYALKPQGDVDGNPATGDANAAGWPFKVGLILPGILPVVGEGITGGPVIGPVSCPSGGAGSKVGVIPDAGPGYILNPDSSSCYGREDGKDIGLQTDTPGGVGRYDTPSFPALGQPAFGDLGDGTAFLAPVIGLKRALDLQGEEYQGGQDFVGAWNGSSGQFRAGWPSPVNDLQFLTGPSVADIDGLPGQEVLAGSASLDLTALNTAGAPVNEKWPKLTTDWLVANPLIGSFSDRLDTAPDSQPKRVIAVTRSGELLVYETSAPPCSPASWPRFHHDNANSGDYSRDAVLPGKPTGLTASDAGEFSFSAPGDDLLCGTAKSFEIVTSDNPIDESNFDDATALEGAPDPPAPGESVTYELPDTAKRYVAVRALDDQGNVGRVASTDRGASAGGGGNGTGGGGGTGGGDGGNGGNGGGTGGGNGGGTGGNGNANGANGANQPSAPARCAYTLSSADSTQAGSDDGETLLGTPGNDVINGNGGRDTVVGLAGADCLTGDEDSDTIRGKSGDDVATGGQGRDFMKGNAGDDFFTGGQGKDRIRLAGGTDEGRGQGGNDNISTGGGKDRINGGPGDDRLFGNAGNDQIRGGNGNDVLFGGGGNHNVLRGGPGRDRCIVMSRANNETRGCEKVLVGGARG